MNCNKFSSCRLEKDYKTPRCNRAKLDTGTFCNYDCEFCYYQGQLHIKTDFETIRKRIDVLHGYGISEVDLSGGESSVHKDWFKILKYCNDRFDNISTLTNGRKFANEKFLIESKAAGLKEILFSVHGYDATSHDEIVRRDGAWKNIMKAVELAHKHDIVVRINCTVYQRNIDGLLMYHEVIKSLKPIEVNFLTLNYWVNNNHADPIDYKLATDNIKSCIDNIKDHVRYINVRYTPYCYMKGYEKYVCNQFQHIYDLYDWNKEVYNYDIDVSRKYTDKEKIDMAYGAAEALRMKDYKKPPACLSCKYLYVCDGVENEVDKFMPLPDSGKKITQVNAFRNRFYDR